MVSIDSCANQAHIDEQMEIPNNLLPVLLLVVEVPLTITQCCTNFYSFAMLGKSPYMGKCDLELSISTKGRNVYELPPSTHTTAPVT